MQYKIHGIHCDACLSLIQMELADIGINQGYSIDKETGLMEMDASAEEFIDLIESTINEMDDYNFEIIE